MLPSIFAVTLKKAALFGLSYALCV